MKYRKTTQQKEGKQTIVEYTEEKQGCPAITVDYERYAHFLENSDLTKEQRRKLIQTLWNIVVEFVSLGFGVHPLQQAKNGCGKLNKNPSKLPLTAPDELYLDHQFLSENLKTLAAPEAPTNEEGVEG